MPITFKKKNFAKSSLDGVVAVGGTSLDVQTGEGALFPAVGATNIFRGVIWGASYATPEADSTREVVTAYQSSTDTFTIVRAQEGTSAKEWADGDNFMLTITSEVLEEYGDLKSDSIVGETPRGTLINGKIVPTVVSDDLVLSLKTSGGNNPSVSDPVYCKIGDIDRSITSALSVTVLDGANTFNAGSTELATKEIDYFVYLGYNATDGVVIGFSRIPGANEYDDFSATTTNEKYCAISTITNAAAGDDYENIGRFAATLSAGAGYTWTVPTFTNKNLIQRPIFETRWLDWLPTYGGDASMTYTLVTTNVGIYKVSNKTCKVQLVTSGTTGGTGSQAITFTLPMALLDTANDAMGNGCKIYDGANLAGMVGVRSPGTTMWVLRYNGSAWSLGSGRRIMCQFFYEI